MTRHDDLTRVGHILDAIAAVLRWTSGKDGDLFTTDDQLQAAVTYQIQVIGEAVSRLSQPFRSAHPEVPWTIMIKMRHILVHDYQRVDAAILWQVVSTDLPPLAEQVRQILNEAE